MEYLKVKAWKCSSRLKFVKELLYLNVLLLLLGYYIKINNLTNSYNFTDFGSCLDRCSYLVKVPTGQYNVSVQVKNTNFASDWSKPTEVLIGKIYYDATFFSVVLN